MLFKLVRASLCRQCSAAGKRSDLCFCCYFLFSLSSSLLSMLLLLLTCPARQELFCISVQSSHRPVNNSTVFEQADFAFYLIDEFWRFCLRIKKYSGKRINVYWFDFVPNFKQFEAKNFKISPSGKKRNQTTSLMVLPSLQWMSDNLSTHCHIWLRPMEVLTAEVEMFPRGKVLYFNQENIYTGFVYLG